MASTFVGTKAQTTAPTREGNGLISVTSTYALAAALVVNDVIQMVKVPKYARVVEIILSTPDLDTGTAITLDVGDGDDTDRYIVSSTVGQAGGVVRLGTNGGNGYQYTAADTIDILVSTGPTTGATSGTITLTVIYDMNP